MYRSVHAVREISRGGKRGGGDVTLIPWFPLRQAVCIACLLALREQKTITSNCKVEKGWLRLRNLLALLSGAVVRSLSEDKDEVCKVP